MTDATFDDPATAGRDALRRLIDLLLQPERFFPQGARQLNGFLLVILVLALGASGTIGRMEMGALRSTATGNALLAVKSWSSYWSAVLAGCLVGGPIAYFVWGWWYRVRARWSGATDVDARLARRICLITDAVIAVPLLVLTAVDSWRYGDPVAMWNGGDVVAMTAMTAPFWSIFVSYRAVRASFSVIRARAIIWFVILPAAFYVSFTLGGVLLGLGLIG